MNDDDNDGGLQEWAETEQERAEYWAKRDAEAIEAHRKWKETFLNTEEKEHA